MNLDDLYDRLLEESTNFIGYPCNANFDYTPLYRFLSFSLNNVGDPFYPSNYHLNTLAYEREVLKIFSKLTEIEESKVWGYVTTGGTEGNHYGLYMARELYPNAIFYYSDSAHYSIPKILRLLGVPNIRVRSNPNGCISTIDLKEVISLHRDKSVVILATAGTTMTGAVDDLTEIKRVLAELSIPNYYIHVDAALSGMILPYITNPPSWNFSAGINSISISGHKMIGSPIPCGIFLTRKRYSDRVSTLVEYIQSPDTTLVGSRNSLTSLFLWYAFKHSDFQDIIAKCLEVANYAKVVLEGYDPFRFPYSNTIVFNRPSQDIISKWQLACQGSICHIITMPHVTKEVIDRFMEDLRGDL